MSDEPVPTQAEIAEATAFITRHTVQELSAMKKGGREWTRAERCVLHGDNSPEFQDRHIAANDALIDRLDKGLPLTKHDAKRARFIKRERGKGETYL